jgi:anti-anti-sigma regulatory factor
MLELKSTLVVRHAPHLQTTIVTLRGETFGSLETGKLQQLQADLTGVSCFEPQLIIDLVGVRQYGSAFLSELIRWIRQLERPEGSVIICVDRTGLLQCCALDRWLTIRPDLLAALNEVACTAA